MKIDTSYMLLTLASDDNKVQYVIRKKVDSAFYLAFVFGSVTHTPMVFAGIN